MDGTPEFLVSLQRSNILFFENSSKTCGANFIFVVYTNQFGVPPEEIAPTRTASAFSGPNVLTKSRKSRFSSIFRDFHWFSTEFQWDSLGFQWNIWWKPTTILMNREVRELGETRKHSLDVYLCLQTFVNH